MRTSDHRSTSVAITRLRLGNRRERRKERSTRVMHRFQEEAKREKKMTESARIDSLNSGDRRRRSHLARSCVPCSETTKRIHHHTTTTVAVAANHRRRHGAAPSLEFIHIQFLCCCLLPSAEWCRGGNNQAPFWTVKIQSR